ncbi:MAG: helix-turn-helix domain-containing protein [Sphaerochaetaceae bacterium]|nr:helix-turn-helix domain-containing protein [Sphaerochaetaceae bacterium]
MDPDVNVVLEYYKHLFPEFNVYHAVVYKLLWRIEPLNGEEIVKQTGFAKSTIYRTLHDLCAYNLVNKTNFKPIGYYVANPMKDYNSNLKKVLTKLEKGAEKLESLLENSTSLSGEIFLVKKDGGQQKLFLKETRALLSETEQLLQIKKAAEEQLKIVDKQKLRTIIAYK